MEIVGVYSFKGGKETVEQKYPGLLKEVQSVISQVDSEKCKTKKSREKTMKGKKLYSPIRLNSAFGKYFTKLGYIDSGIEIVPVKKFADQMSTGVSYFEQFVWDLEQRGIADIDIPVLILGIDK